MRKSNFIRLAVTTSVAAALILSVSGCIAAEPSAAPTASATASPTATPTPSPPALVAARIHIDALSVSVLTDDGQALGSYAYRGFPQEAVDGLTVALGQPDIVETQPGDEGRSGVMYTWDGFALYALDSLATIPDAELPDYASRWHVRVTAASARGLIVETIDGVRVGDSTTAVSEQHPDAVQRFESPTKPASVVYLGAVTPPGMGPDTASYNPDYRWGVWLSDDDPTDTIDYLSAPSSNFGD